MSEHLKEYEYLWDGSSSGWVLLRAHDSHKGDAYSVFNKSTSMLLLIEDDSVREEVCEKLLSQGVEVLERIPRSEFNIDNLDIENGK